MAELDRIDKKILDVLQRDGRISMTELAHSIGLSTSPCSERVKRMEREGWLTRAEAVALERYELLVEQAGYGTGRSGLDMSPRGGGGPEGVIDRLAAARRLLAMARNAVGNQIALIFVDAVLSPYGSETIDDVSERLLHGAGGKAARNDLARQLVSYVAAGLVVHFAT